MTHIMVDLETWGTAPGCDIRSIGAVVFDPIAGTIGDEFYVNVNQGVFYGLKCDPSTIKWWGEQSVAAQERLADNQQPICHALGLFREWWGDRDPEGATTFWAHGPHFDEAILAACYRATRIVVPWNYRAPRDTRTIYEAAGGNIEVPFEGTEHNALDDAKHQARCVIEAYRRLRAPVEATQMLQESLVKLRHVRNILPGHDYACNLTKRIVTFLSEIHA